MKLPKWLIIIFLLISFYVFYKYITVKEYDYNTKSTIIEAWSNGYILGMNKIITGCNENTLTDSYCRNSFYFDSINFSKKADSLLILFKNQTIIRK